MNHKHPFIIEGLKYSIEEMTEIKLLVMNNYLD